MENNIKISDGFKFGIGFLLANLLFTIIIGGITLIVIYNLGIFNSNTNNRTINSPYYYN